MIVELMLRAIRIHDDVPSQLTVVTQMKALIRKHFDTLAARLIFFATSKPPITNWRTLGSLPDIDEYMVPFFDLAPNVRATSSEARIRPEVRVFDVLPKLRIVSAAGYENFSKHHCLRGRLGIF